MADGRRRADAAPARIRFALLLGTILATLLATGCATIPSSGPVGGRLARSDHVKHQSELHTMFAISISGKRNNFPKYGIRGSCGDSGMCHMKRPHFP